MKKINTLLNLRLKQKKEKLLALSEIAKNKNVDTFSGIFKITPLTEKEKEEILNILENFKNDTKTIEQDKNQLFQITSEIKAITGQAAILHGQRIKKAQSILKNYKDGAFTLWLLKTYGNRQTPYNFLKYFEFYTSLSEDLQKKVLNMPRQAIYTLASRDGNYKEKEKIIQNFKNETKQELLSLIREFFPLKKRDKRKENIAKNIFSILENLKKTIFKKPLILKKIEKEKLLKVLKEIKSKIENF